MVSIHNGSANSLSAITTPYEPGSTLKPFTVAGLVHNGLASLADTVDTGIGSWEINKRTIHDVHPEGGVMSLSHALQISSNVGIAKAAQVLTDTIQYENLRDFGFGVATGIRLPGEGKGMLRRPEEWSIQSAVSLAIGYEISVTPLQMAMAYGALANGGKLYKPRIVKEVRDAQGKIEKVPSRVVRRVVSPTVTKEISEVLVGVIEDGTGRRAGLSTFAVAGKSGTTRAWSNGSYEEGAYFSSFVGFFPAEDPQVVILVKLDRPEGAYYGGATAAPVIRATMTDILASPRQLLDWTSLGDLQIPPENPLPKSTMMLASNLSVGVTTSDIISESHVEVNSDATTVVVMPDVRGLTSRSAVSMIHELGLRVQWSGTGKILETNPRAGLVVSKGDTVSLVSRRSDGDG
jgi:cell division protein FtsI (penicillin-binding protein 3)